MNYTKTIKRLLFIIVLQTNVFISVAQNDFDLTQKWFNETLYNPASAGNNFSTGVFLHTRQQWVGISGAPLTLAGTVDTYIEDLRSGIGLTFAADKLGSVSSYNARFAYAFYIPVGDKAVLSLGLSGGILARNRRVTGGGSEDLDDPSLVYGNVSDYSPDFDFGFEFKGPFKLGASIRHLAVQTPRYNLPKHSINIWAYLSSRFNVSESLSLEPMIAMLNNASSYRGEAGALMYFLKTERRNTYSDRFWIGALYRTGNSFAILAGVNLTPKIRLGYSFDYGIGDLSSIAKGGTHELFLSFYLNRIFYKDETCPAYRNYRRR
ncbi:MAG: PorP/SprF family type IX secretion system membrane protein [Prevotellaceae bacterium]|nr:PorP/SprF family type IX secretion system membrane protein [Prevotellaceae bacterium]